MLEVVLGKTVTSDQDAEESPVAFGLFKVDPSERKQKVGVLLIVQVVTETAPPGIGNTFETYGGRAGAVAVAMAFEMLVCVRHAVWLTTHRVSLIALLA